MNLKLQREKIRQKALDENYAIVSFSLDGIIKNVNKKFLEVFSYKKEEVVGQNHSLLCDKEFVQSGNYKKFWYELSTGKSFSKEFKRIKKNGEAIFLQALYKPLRNEYGEIFEIIKFAQDITNRKLVDLNYEGQIQAINKSQAVVEFDMSGIILRANDIFLNALGYSSYEIIGKHHKILCEDEYSLSSEYKEFWAKLNKGYFDTGKYLRIGKNSKKVWIQATYTPILDINKKPIKIVKFAQDITQFEIVKKDQLTGLLTREQLIYDLELSDKNNNLAIIDINNFSSISDFFGYYMGNKLIIKFSNILKKLFDNNFTLYRLYADKFAVLNTSLTNEDFFIFMRKISNKFKETTISLDIKKVHLVTTIGISYEDKNKILNTAEIVCKYAKNKNKNIFTYSKNLNIEKEYEENLKWIGKIKSALDNDRIVLHYQAIYNNKTNKIEKYESLVRLIDQDGSIISPFKFLDISKKSRQYVDITKRVIEKSFEKFKDKEYEFSINLTLEDILDEDLNKYLFDKIEKYNFGEKLVIELVESERITTYQNVYRFIDKIKSLGCKIAIDDFGSGYSNFEYLVKVDADYVKIDGSIIKRILEDTNSLELVKSILIFSKKIGVKTIAEYIYSEELLEKVKSLEIDYSQGFYIGKPQESIN